MTAAISSKTSRSSSSAPGAVRISITWRSVRTFAVQMMSVLSPSGASRRSADVTSFLTSNGTPSSSMPSRAAASTWNSSSCSTMLHDLLADRLQRRRHAKADLAEPDVAQALLAEGRARPVADELVREHA